LRRRSRERDTPATDKVLKGGVSLSELSNYTEWLQAIGSIVESLGVAAGAVFAGIGVTTWRRQLLGKRKVEIAEEALVAAYRVREAFNVIRSPIIFEGEGETRQKSEDEDAGLAIQRRAAFVPVERVNKFSEAFADLAKARLLVKTYFGPQAAKPFDDFFQARYDILVAASLFSEMAEEEVQGKSVDAGEKRECRRTLYAGSREDKLKPLIDRALKAIEDLCADQLNEAKRSRK